MKLTAATIFLFIFFLIPSSSFAQGENNIWCFGYQAGLDFTGGPPVQITTPMITNEACGAVCDATGNLLFYSNGNEVYDAANNVMPNGSGLLGGNSATQGVAIVQSFSNSSQYFLFTMDNIPAYPATTGYLRYSVIDMTLNAGLGDIIAGQKNILLDSGILEKMLVVKGNGCFNWLLAHHMSSPIFYAYKIDASGINTPVVSTSGFHNATYYYALGEMNVAAGDSVIALVTYGNPLLELHSFNNSTGVVSNCADLDSSLVNGDTWYGLSFSPDGSRLYRAAFAGTAGLYQYDMTLMPNVAAVYNSRTLIDNHFFSGMRIGPDNKVYLENGFNGMLNVINNPNALGPACNFGVTGLTGGQGLGTNFVAHQVALPVTFSHDTTACLGLNTLTLSGPPGYASYVWSDGQNTQSDTFSQAGTKWLTSMTGCAVQVDTYHVTAGPINTTTIVKDTSLCFAAGPVTLSAIGGYDHYRWSDNTILQTNTFATAGTKWVEAQTGCTMLVDTFHVTAHLDTSRAAKDTSICFLNNYPIVTAPVGYTSYLWSDGFTQQQDTFGAPGTKWVYAQNGCSLLIDTFHVHDWRDTTRTSRDTIHCVAYSPITIYAPGGYTSYLWNDGKTTQVDTFFASVTKWVTALNGCNVRVDTVHFTATTIPQDSVEMHGTDTAICFEAGVVNVSAPGGYTYYLWSDNNTQQTDLFSSPATKWVYAQKLCYLLIDTFSVQDQATDTLRGRVDTTLCFSSQVSLAATAGYLSYQWSDGNTTQSDTFTASSTKVVYAHKACEEAIDTFHVQFINNLSVDLGPDTAICKGETVTLNATNTLYNTTKYLWQDGTTTPKYTVTSGGDYSVIVSVGPCSASDTVRVHEKIIDIHLGNGLIPCHQDSIVLDAGVDNATYLWQDGSTKRTYKATKEGSYSVKVTQDDCSATASVAVRFEGCDCIVVLPTAFSPNNDSRNDKFGPVINCPLSSFKMMIYNRWGNQVFYSEDVNSRWDGTVKGIPVDGDTFNYYLEFKDSDGKSYYYKGTITLVR